MSSTQDEKSDKTRVMAKLHLLLVAKLHLLRLRRFHSMGSGGRWHQDACCSRKGIAG